MGWYPMWRPLGRCKYVYDTSKPRVRQNRGRFTRLGEAFNFRVDESVIVGGNLAGYAIGACLYKPLLIVIPEKTGIQAFGELSGSAALAEEPTHG